MESQFDERHEPQASGQPDQPQESGWALAAHLSLLVMIVGVPGFLGPLVVFFLKPADDQRAAAEAREALNFGLSLLLYAVALLVLGVVAMFDGTWTGIAAVALIGLALLLASLVLPIIASVKVAGGDRYRYPLTMRFF